MFEEGINYHHGFSVLDSWLAVSADMVTFISYSLIGVFMLWHQTQVLGAARSKLTLSYAAFIILCGLNHLIHATNAFYPLPLITLIVMGSMALVSAYVSIITLPYQRAEIKEANQLSVKSLVRKVNDLEAENKSLRDELKTQ